MATPTGAAAPPAEMSTRKPKGKGKGKGRSSSPFLASSARQMHMEIMGEDTPGPGAYLPASTFGKYAAKSNKQFAKLASPEFRSSSTQRPRVKNPDFPGPGAHTPNKTVTSDFKNRTNSAPHLHAKGQRFAASNVAAVENGTDNLGPGAYEAHEYNSMQMAVSKEVQMMSRQNPGFGIAGPAHKLPHEQPVEDDKELPGPGKYETNTSRINEASGHASSFKPPTAGPKLKSRYGGDRDPVVETTKKGRPGSSKGGKSSKK